MEPRDRRRRALGCRLGHRDHVARAALRHLARRAAGGKGLRPAFGAARDRASHSWPRSCSSRACGSSRTSGSAWPGSCSRCGRRPWSGGHGVARLAGPRPQLVAYGLLSRAPVAIVMLLAMRGQLGNALRLRGRATGAADAARSRTVPSRWCRSSCSGWRSRWSRGWSRARSPPRCSAGAAEDAGIAAGDNGAGRRHETEQSGSQPGCGAFRRGGRQRSRRERRGHRGARLEGACPRDGVREDDGRSRPRGVRDVRRRGSGVPRTNGAARPQAAVAEGWKPLLRGAEGAVLVEAGARPRRRLGDTRREPGRGVRPDGKRVGTFTSTWRLEKDGEWRVVLDSGCPPCACASPAEKRQKGKMTGTCASAASAARSTGRTSSAAPTAAASWTTARSTRTATPVAAAAPPAAGRGGTRAPPAHPVRDPARGRARAAGRGAAGGRDRATASPSSPRRARARPPATRSLVARGGRRGGAARPRADCSLPRGARRDSTPSRRASTTTAAATSSAPPAAPRSRRAPSECPECGLALGAARRAPPSARAAARRCRSRAPLPACGNSLIG